MKVIFRIIFAVMLIAALPLSCFEDNTPLNSVEDTENPETDYPGQTDDGISGTVPDDERLTSVETAEADNPGDAPGVFFGYPGAPAEPQTENFVRLDPSTINPDSYPEMDNREIGHMRYYFKIAAQDMGDFKHMKSPNLNMIPGTGDLQFRESAYRYQLAFMVYFLATEQFHKLPACLDIIKPRMDRLIQKMLHRDVWEYWGRWVSRGLFIAEPKLLPIWAYPARHDPIDDDNIMYSGHLAHMIGLYEKLYGDMKWSVPDSIVLKWSDSEVFYYDTLKIQQAMLKQSLSDQVCIECEPNFCFPMCNTHPILAYKLYDDIHGTDHYEQARDRYMEWIYEKGIVSPESHEMATFYLVKQGITVVDDNIEFGNLLDVIIKPLVKSGLIYGNLAAGDGWSGYFMHPFATDLVERNYPYWIENHVININDKLADVTVDRFEDQLGIGFFAMLMSEVGETEFRDKLVRMAQLRYRPIWGVDGTYHYPFFEDSFLSGGPISRFTANGLSGKLLASALACPPDGMIKMHNEPFITSDPSAPMVADVDFPKILLRRAIYDKDYDALIITTDDPWEKINYYWQKSTFNIKRLDPSKTWVLKIDGNIIGRYTGVTAIPVTVKVLGRHDIILYSE